MYGDYMQASELIAALQRMHEERIEELRRIQDSIEVLTRYQKATCTAAAVIAGIMLLPIGLLILLLIVIGSMH